MHRTKKIISIVTFIAFVCSNSYAAPSQRSFFKDKAVDRERLSTQQEEFLSKKRDFLKNKDYDTTKENSNLQAKKALELNLQDLSRIHIPSEIGRIIEVYEHREQDPPLIVHIQDLHTNPEAELNLARILEILVKDYKLDLVCSEGADGIVDTSSISSFPDYSVREKVARLFVDSGELTGEEYLSITKYPDLLIWGIEDRELYFKNIIEFNRIMKFAPQSQLFISQAKKALEELKNKIYSRELKAIEQAESDYDNKKIEIGPYLSFLAGYIEKLAIPTQKYANIRLLAEAIDQEKAINLLKIQDESQKLIVNLQVAISNKGMREDKDGLMAKLELFRNQKISPFSFYSYLKDLALRHLSGSGDRVTGIENYPHLNDYITYLTKVNSLDQVKLFNELRGLTYEVKLRIASNDREKTLVAALRNINFLESFFNLKVSNEELDYYLNNKDEHKVGWFKSAIESIEHRAKSKEQRSFVDYNPDIIDSKLLLLEDFYKTVKARDIAMVEKSILEIENRSSKVSALISGGFHTKGITTLLREKGYSYIVISPSSSSDVDEGNYHFLLSGRRRPLTEILNKLDFSKTIKAFENLRNSLRVPMVFSDFREALVATGILPASVETIEQAIGAAIIAYGGETLARLQGQPIFELIVDKNPDGTYTFSFRPKRKQDFTVFNVASDGREARVVDTDAPRENIASAPKGTARIAHYEVKEGRTIEFVGADETAQRTELLERRQEIDRELRKLWVQVVWHVAGLGVSLARIPASLSSVPKLLTDLLDELMWRIKSGRLMSFSDFEDFLGDLGKVIKITGIPKGILNSLGELRNLLESIRNLTIDRDFLERLLGVEQRTEAPGAWLPQQTMPDGTEIWLINSPEQLPKEVQTFWHSHDSLYILVNPALGYSAFIGLHRSMPWQGEVKAIGDVHMELYASIEKAMQHALTLSEDKTRAAALTGLLWDEQSQQGKGGGMVVIHFDPDAPKAQVVQDSVNHSLEALDIIVTEQNAELTAKGLQVALLASFPYAFSDEEPLRTGAKPLKDKRILLQGLGDVGREWLSILLDETDAAVIAADLRPEAIKAVTQQFDEAIASGRLQVLGAVDFKKLYFSQGDIFVSTEEVLDRLTTIPRLIHRAQVKLILGNTSRLTSASVQQTHSAGVLIVPDYVANYGGMIDEKRLSFIGEQLAPILKESQQSGRSPVVIAREITDILINEATAQRASMEAEGTAMRQALLDRVANEVVKLKGTEQGGRRINQVTTNTDALRQFMRENGIPVPQDWTEEDWRQFALDVQSHPALGVGIGSVPVETIAHGIIERDRGIWQHVIEGGRPVADDIVQWLGWVDAPVRFLERIEPKDSQLNALQRQLDEEGITNVVVLGTGGSGLSPWTYGKVSSKDNLIVVDLEDPQAIQNALRWVNERGWANTVFIVQTKSWGTTETRNAEAIFRQEAAIQLGARNAVAQHFVAVTDAGNISTQEARDFRLLGHGKNGQEVRALFINNRPSDADKGLQIGGRYSAFSYFGLVPAVLAGIPYRDILVPGRDEYTLFSSQEGEYIGVRLGAELNRFRNLGRNKITFLSSPELEAFGPWAQQLVNESVGKIEDSPVFISGEEFSADPSVYGGDRVFVRVKIGEIDSIEVTEQSGLPIIELRVRAQADFEAGVRLMYRFMAATAVLGNLMGVHPFNQPFVEDGKRITKRLLAPDLSREELTQELNDAALATKGLVYRRDGISIYFTGRTQELIGVRPADASMEEILGAFFAAIHSGDYLYLSPYTYDEPGLQEAFSAIRTDIRDKHLAHPATLFGIGSRCQHSDNQLNNATDQAVVIVFTFDPVPGADMDVPGRNYTLAQENMAHALGTVGALEERGRRVIRIHLSNEHRMQPQKIRQLFSRALQSYIMSQVYTLSAQVAIDNGEAWLRGRIEKLGENTILVLTVEGAGQYRIVNTWRSQNNWTNVHLRLRGDGDGVAGLELGSSDEIVRMTQDMQTLFNSILGLGVPTPLQQIEADRETQEALAGQI